MAWAFVQGKTLNNQASPMNLAYTGNVTAGNLLLVLVSHATNSVASVSDSRTSTWTKAVGHYSTAQDYSLELFYALAASSGADTITVTVSGGADELSIAEYSGVAASAPLDVTANAEGTTTAISSGSATTTVDGDLIVGGMVSVTVAAGTGFTLDVHLTPGTTIDMGIEQKTQATHGSVAATGTGSTFWIALMATFKPAAGGTTYNDSLALGLTGSFTNLPALTIPASLAVSLASAFAISNTATWSAALALALSGVFDVNSQATFLASLAISAATDIVMNGGSLFTESLGLGLTGGFTMAQQAQLVGALALALAGAIDQTGSGGTPVTSAVVDYVTTFGRRRGR